MLREILRLFGHGTPPVTLADQLPSIQRERQAYLLASETVEAEVVYAEHPPRVEHVKKKLLFDIALAHPPIGTVSVFRYREIPVPEVFRPFSPDTEVVAKRGYFRYDNDDSADHWHMNFAHHDLFNGYGHFMFAQDEIQVAEHPVLSSIREMMLCRTDRLRPLTAENGSPTPVLFRTVPRTLSIDTSSIYGARFARADDSTIRDCANAVEPASHSNILAIEAPISAGNRIYARGEIELALRTAYSGFRAIVLDTEPDSLSTRPIVLHTGNWGCGAYGGNRQLMLSIQVMAARLAGITRIEFHCGTDDLHDVAAFDMALQNQFKFKPGVRTAMVLQRIISTGFLWGTPDGN